MIEDIIRLVIATLCLLWGYKLITKPHPAWVYMDDEEKQFYKKWFIFPRLWK